VNPNHRVRVTTFGAGILGILVACVGTYLVFTKSIPFRHHFEIKAVFTNSNLVRPTSPVRIAGVDVGKVTAVEKYKDTNLSVVTMRIDDRGRPIHADATAKVRPRLFLEGNFYVELRPGTADAKVLGDGGLIPVTQTARPVQLDEVLSALTTDSRKGLQETIKGLGVALDGKPSAAEDARQDPAVAGLTGAQALNQTFKTSPDSLRGSAVVNDALLGEHPGDLSNTVSGFAKATKALADNEVQLRDLVTHFDQTMAAFASQSTDLAKAISVLGPTAANARAGFASLARAIPATRQFARDLAPGVAETPATIAAADPWLLQAKPLLSQQELGGFLNSLAPATSDLAKLGYQTRRWLPRIDAFNRCITNVFLPTGNVKVDDGALSSGVENYKEFWYSMVGSAGEAQGFDGNGPFLRISAAGGPNTIELGPTNYQGSKVPLFANPTEQPVSTRPAFPNKLPELRRDVPCASQKVPDVNGPASTGPADGASPSATAPQYEKDPGVKMETRK